MATAQFIHDGDYVDYTPSADVSAGDVIVQGDLVGVAKGDIEAGRLGAIAVTGVFDFPKATGVGSAISAGSIVYWDAGAKEATTSSGNGANKELGKTITDAGDNDSTVRVRLSQ